MVVVGNFWEIGSASGSTFRFDVNASIAPSGTYVSMMPTRIEDTRPQSGFSGAGVTVGAGGTLNIQVSGSNGVPVGGVSAAVLNITAIEPSSNTYLTAYPENVARPVVANLNVVAGETLANLVTVPLGIQGGVTIYNHSGNVEVVADLDGYYTTTPQGIGLYDPVNPVRVFGALASGTVIGTGVSDAVAVAGGATGVPTDASAVVVIITGVGSSESSFLTAYPAPSTGVPEPPTAANVVFGPNQIVGNRATVAVGSNGDIEVYNHSGSVHVDVDLYGYYTGTVGDLGSAFTPLAPERFTDTRAGVNGSAISPVSSESFSFISDSIPTTATALASNVTVVSGDSSGYLTIYPVNESSPPGVGDVVFTSNGIAQNFDLMPLEGSTSRIFNSSTMPVDLVIDAFGYFSPPPRAVQVVADPSTLPANGFVTSVLSATVTTGSGIAFDDPVTLSTKASVPGSCGSTTLAGSTNASGRVTSMYTASNTAGTCTVTFTETNGGATGAATITQI
jgi:hypothetical protein